MKGDKSGNVGFVAQKPKESSLFSLKRVTLLLLEEKSIEAGFSLFLPSYHFLFALIFLPPVLFLDSLFLG